MTRLQTAIAAAEKGDENEARSVMALMREWFGKFTVLWAIIRQAHLTGNEEQVTKVLLEAESAAKRIRSEVDRADAYVFHATSLAQIGRLDEALAYAQDISDHYAGFYTVQALVSIALILRKMNKPYSEILEKAGKLSQTVVDESPYFTGGSQNWLGQVALREALCWWKKEGHLDEIVPFAKKYLTDPVILNVLLES